MNDDKEYNNTYAIPANYTDSGKIFGGLLEIRNAIETVILIILLGYPELVIIPMPGNIRIVVMAVTIIPVAIVAMMGIDGDSIFQYLTHIIKYAVKRRKLHFERVGYKYAPQQLRQKSKNTTSKKAKNKARKAGIRSGLYSDKIPVARNHNNHRR